MDTATQDPAQARSSPAPRRTYLFELAGYVGLALTIAGTAVAFVSRTPSQSAIVGLEVIISCGLLAAGSIVGRAANDAFLRMRSVMWFGAVGTWAYAAGILLGPAGANVSGRAYPLLVAVAISAMAVPLWLIERRSLQAIAAIVAVLATLVILGFVNHVTTIRVPGGSGFTYTTDAPNLTPDALITLCYGAAAIFLGWRGTLAPKRTMMVLGSIFAIYGASFLSYGTITGPTTVGLVVALLVSALILCIGELADVLAVRGLGIIGLVSITSGLVAAHVHAEIGGWAIGAVGLVLLGATVYLAMQTFPARRAPAISSSPIPPMPPPLSGGDGEPQS